jgi:hypothetical protein
MHTRLQRCIQQTTKIKNSHNLKVFCRYYVFRDIFKKIGCISAPSIYGIITNFVKKEANVNIC